MTFFSQREFLFGSPVVLFGFETLMDVTKTKALLQEYKSVEPSKENWDEYVKELGGVSTDEAEAMSSLVEGKLIIIFEQNSTCVIAEPVPKSLDRSIEGPTNENVLQGPMSSFIEDVDSNIGLMRKQMNTEKMQMKSFSAGKIQKKETVLALF